MPLWPPIFMAVFTTSSDVFALLTVAKPPLNFFFSLILWPSLNPIASRGETSEANESRRVSGILFSYAFLLRLEVTSYGPCPPAGGNQGGRAHPAGPRRTPGGTGQTREQAGAGRDVLRKQNSRMERSKDSVSGAISTKGKFPKKNQRDPMSQFRDMLS